MGVERSIQRLMIEIVTIDNTVVREYREPTQVERDAVIDRMIELRRRHVDLEHYFPEKYMRYFPRRGEHYD